MNPSSRGGATCEFNLFPYKITRHNSWHRLFLNMTIWEVWENLDEIYDAIFHDDNEFINRYWLFMCKLSSATDLRCQIDKVYNIEFLRDNWANAFGGRGLTRAKKFLQYKTLFIVFGSDMACLKKFFNEGKLIYFFESFPLKGEREWAFRACFGDYTDWQSPNWQDVILGISEILRRSP